MRPFAQNLTEPAFAPPSIRYPWDGDALDQLTNTPVLRLDGDDFDEFHPIPRPTRSSSGQPGTASSSRAVALRWATPCSGWWPMSSAQPRRPGWSCATSRIRRSTRRCRPSLSTCRPTGRTGTTRPTAIGRRRQRDRDLGRHPWLRPAGHAVALNARGGTASLARSLRVCRCDRAEGARVHLLPSRQLVDAEPHERRCRPHLRLRGPGRVQHRLAQTTCCAPSTSKAAQADPWDWRVFASTRCTRWIGSTRSPRRRGRSSSSATSASRTTRTSSTPTARSWIASRSRSRASRELSAAPQLRERRMLQLVDRILANSVDAVSCSRPTRVPSPAPIGPPSAASSG